MDKFIKLAGVYHGWIIGTEAGELGFITSEFLRYTDPGYLSDFHSQYLRVQKVPEDVRVWRVPIKTDKPGQVRDIELNRYICHNYEIICVFDDALKTWFVGRVDNAPLGVNG